MGGSVATCAQNDATEDQQVDMSRFYCGCTKTEGKEAQQYDFEPRGLH